MKKVFTTLAVVLMVCFTMVNVASAGLMFSDKATAALFMQKCLDKLEVKMAYLAAHKCAECPKAKECADKAVAEKKEEVKPAETAAVEVTKPVEVKPVCVCGKADCQCGCKDNKPCLCKENATAVKEAKDTDKKEVKKAKKAKKAKKHHKKAKKAEKVEETKEVKAPADTKETEVKK
ncbi:MAG: hypothetical protein QMC67_16580 [Candidatus Wallbacteria bacterium]